MYAQEDNYNSKTYANSRIYNAGIYLRLSREDENLGQSESIINQKEFLTLYVIHQGWNLVDIYTDDGYTGTNFYRPDFKRMIKDIESKRINLVVTKDLSRLGRDYIDTGYYLERYFPEHDVRYIAVNDGIDTFSNNSNNDMSPFKSVINDMYAKDISKKVRTAFKTKREKGDFVGSFVPYGYVKDPTNKNKLIIDDLTAGVVKRIFNMFVSGVGFGRIARILNSEVIPSPGAYKMDNSNFKRPKSMRLWVDATVKYIIQNPTYAGNVTQNRYAKINYKVNKLKRVPKEYWVTVNNSHEAIVDEDTFNFAQEIIERRVGKDYSKGNEHLLSGLMYCGNCGERISFTQGSNGVIYTLCSKYKRFRSCTRHSMKEADLETYVLSELKKISEYAVNHEKFLKSAKENHKNNNDEEQFDKKIHSIENRLSEIKRIVMGLYEDKIKSILNESDFLEFSQTYNSERKQLNARLSQILEQKARYEETEKNSNDLIDQVKDLLDFQNVNKAILIKLIDKIVLFDKKRLEIHYRFKKPF